MTMSSLVRACCLPTGNGKLTLSVLTACCVFVFTGCGDQGSAGPPQDEAKRDGKTVADYPTATADVFHEMDGGIALDSVEVMGRNTWMTWTGGNEAFWDYLAKVGYGITDLVKMLDSRKRDTRFADMGVINEPGFTRNDQPDQWGLYLDKPVGSAGFELFSQEGIEPEVYGYSSGVVGLRLFENPEFDDAAQEHWDAEKFYNEREYYEDPDLVRPYRVGMACSFCHVGPHPLHPPDDPENPEWRNLSATIGQQWLATQPALGSTLEPNNYFYQLLTSARRGALDTSLLASDGNNNPNIMNPIWQLAARLSLSVPEPLGEATTVLPDALRQRDAAGRDVTPHVLADGADAIGVYGALARVFLNIGEFHQDWVTHFNLVIGMRPQTPIQIRDAQENSVFWNVTEERVPPLALYFIKAAKNMPLANAEGGAVHLTATAAQITRGKEVFARTCFGCHSSKQPANFRDIDPWARSGDSAYVAWARRAVMQRDFLVENYLSTDERIPIRVVQTNAGRALADNATRGHIWDNFSSETYKNLPTGGPITVWNPWTGDEFEFETPAGGPGYYRVTPLVGIWATSPLLHNNMLGTYNGDPSVAGRLAVFDEAIDQLLWPERRPSRYRYVAAENRWVPTDLKAAIWRTDRESELRIPARYLPQLIEGRLGRMSRLLLPYPWVVPLILLLLGAAAFHYGRKQEKKALRLTGIASGVLAVVVLFGTLFVLGRFGDLQVGPIPEGTPVNLIANVNPAQRETGDILRLVGAAKRTFKRIKREGLEGEAKDQVLGEEIGTQLLEHWLKSPDLIEDRGHYFGTRLTDREKQDLKTFLKTF